MWCLRALYRPPRRSENPFRPRRAFLDPAWSGAKRSVRATTAVGRLLGPSESRRAALRGPKYSWSPAWTKIQAA